MLEHLDARVAYILARGQLCAMSLRPPLSERVIAAALARQRTSPPQPSLPQSQPRPQIYPPVQMHPPPQFPLPQMASRPSVAVTPRMPPNGQRPPNGQMPPNAQAPGNNQMVLPPRVPPNTQSPPPLAVWRSPPPQNGESSSETTDVRQLALQAHKMLAGEGSNGEPSDETVL